MEISKAINHIVTHARMHVCRYTHPALLSFLLLDFPRERVPVVLAPLLYQNQLDITEERQVMLPQTSPEVSTPLLLAVCSGLHTTVTNTLLLLPTDFSRAKWHYKGVRLYSNSDVRTVYSYCVCPNAVVCRVDQKVLRSYWVTWVCQEWLPVTWLRYLVRMCVCCVCACARALLGSVPVCWAKVSIPGYE